MLANGLPQNCGEIIIREGNAVKLHEPVKVDIEGTIDAPARWLETRHDCLKEKNMSCGGRPGADVNRASMQ